MLKIDCRCRVGPTRETVSEVEKEHQAMNELPRGQMAEFLQLLKQGLPRDDARLQLTGRMASDVPNSTVGDASSQRADPDPVERVPAPAELSGLRINAPVCGNMEADIVDEVSAAVGLTPDQVRQVSASLANTILTKLFSHKALSILGLWHAKLTLRTTPTPIREAARTAASRGRSRQWRFKKWAITIKTRPKLKRIADTEPIPLALQ